MSRKRPSLIARFFFLLNNLLVLITWAAYLAWFINPSVFPFGGMLALAVPAFILANSFFIIFWLIFFRRYVWLSIITVALGWWHISGLVGFTQSRGGSTQNNNIRVMSYNVRSFHYPGPYKWHNTPPGMKAMADTVNPDILCMQEYLPGGDWQPGFPHKYRYAGDKKHMTMAIYSRHRIINEGTIPWAQRAGEYDGFIYADIMYGSDTIRIINVHLMSVGINHNDLRTLRNIDQSKEEELQKSSKTIYRQLMNAYRIRGGQVKTLVNFIGESPHPVILCGDLNDTPTTYTYRKLTAILKDTFSQTGKGFGTSFVKFNSYHLPLRIDHILMSSEFEAVNWKRVDAVLSDHYPVYADIILKY